MVNQREISPSRADSVDVCSAEHALDAFNVAVRMIGEVVFESDVGRPVMVSGPVDSSRSYLPRSGSRLE
jgi:hypothetical protein